MNIQNEFVVGVILKSKCLPYCHFYSSFYSKKWVSKWYWLYLLSSWQSEDEEVQNIILATLTPGLHHIRWYQMTNWLSPLVLHAAAAADACLTSLNIRDNFIQDMETRDKTLRDQFLAAKAAQEKQKSVCHMTFELINQASKHDSNL